MITSIVRPSRVTSWYKVPRQHTGALNKAPSGSVKSMTGSPERYPLKPYLVIFNTPPAS